LAHSQVFTKTVTGFSSKGSTTLDLADIGFVGAGEARFSGTKKSGVLTVTDGTNTAFITLNGDYLRATFVTANDGHGGTDVVAQDTPAVAAPLHAFASAMAEIGTSSESLMHADESRVASPHTSSLARAPTAVEFYCGANVRNLGGSALIA
jgi:hypothetical protein